MPIVKTMDDLMSEECSGVIPAKSRSMVFRDKTEHMRKCKKRYEDEFAAAGREYPAPSPYYEMPERYAEIPIVRDCFRDAAEYDENMIIGFAPFNIDCWAAMVLKHDAETGKDTVAAAEDSFYMEGICRIMLKSEAHCRQLYADLTYIFNHCCVSWDFKERRGSYAISRHVIDYIEKASAWYGEYALCVRQLLLHIYYGMIAEECKKGAIMGRLVKMAAMWRISNRVYHGVPVDVFEICNCDKKSYRMSRQMPVDNLAFRLAAEYATMGLYTERSKRWLNWQWRFLSTISDDYDALWHGAERYTRYIIELLGGTIEQIIGMA